MRTPFSRRVVSATWALCVLTLLAFGGKQLFSQHRFMKGLLRLKEPKPVDGSIPTVHPFFPHGFQEFLFAGDFLAFSLPCSMVRFEERDFFTSSPLSSLPAIFTSSSSSPPPTTMVTIILIIAAVFWVSSTSTTCIECCLSGQERYDEQIVTGVKQKMSARHSLSPPTTVSQDIS